MDPRIASICGCMQPVINGRDHSENGCSMRTVTVFILLVSLMTVLTPQIASAATFGCPRQPVADRPSKEIAKLPAGEALADSAKIDATVNTLRQRGLSSGTIVDSIISAYCPVVGERSGLTKAQKTSAIEAYAAKVAKIVYAYSKVDRIFLEVPLPPSVAAAVQSKADASGMSAEEWVAGIVEQAVAGKNSP